MRHLAKHFGTERFTADEAAKSPAPQDSAEAQGTASLPRDTHGWAETLRGLVERDLALAELEGFRLTEAVIRAATILNI